MVKNENYGQTRKLWSKIEFFVKKSKFYCSRMEIFVKNGMMVKNRNYGQKWKLWSKTEIMVKLIKIIFVFFENQKILNFSNTFLKKRFSKKDCLKTQSCSYNLASSTRHAFSIFWKIKWIQNNCQKEYPFAKVVILRLLLCQLYVTKNHFFIKTKISHRAEKNNFSIFDFDLFWWKKK